MQLSLATSECYWNLRKAPSSNLIVMLKAPAKHIVSLPFPILGVEKTNQKYTLQKNTKSIINERDMRASYISL